MERLRSLRTIVLLIAGLLVFEIAAIVLMLRPGFIFLWLTLGIIGLLCAYLVRLSLMLIKELKDLTKDK